MTVRSVQDRENLPSTWLTRSRMLVVQIHWRCSG
jgi:hypothetical protein